MPSPAETAEQTLRGARAVLERRRFAAGASIGRHSQQLKFHHAVGRIWRMMAGVGAVVLAAMVTGLAIGGIGFDGLMVTGLGAISVAALLLRYPRLRVPSREQLARGNVKGIVGNTQLWLEAQRPALPLPAVRLVDQIGAQLDVLNLQLAEMDDDAPAAADVRRLVGEHLPDLVAAYTGVPVPLRAEPRAGASPDDQLAASLARISTEIDTVTRQLADRAIDRLAVQSRYLDTRYGGDQV